MPPLHPTSEKESPSPRRGFLARSLALLGSAFFAGASKLVAGPVKSKTNTSEAGLPTPLLTDEPFLGEIVAWAGTFAPRGWAFCNGQLLPISQNQALFSILGTTYGGNGQTTFALPDLRGRMPIHFSNDFALGQAGGEETHTLTQGEIPLHTHSLLASLTPGTSDNPVGNALAMNAEGIRQYGDSYNQTMAPAAIASSGGNQPHNNMPPYLTIRFIIALQGIFPSRQ